MTSMRILALLVSAMLPALARADLYVIVNANNPVTTMTKSAVVDIYMGRKRAFSGSDYALPFDQSRDGPVRERFYALLTGMSLSQVNGYWARLMFTGQVLPPESLQNDSAVLEIVRRNTGAVGYVESEPNVPGVKVVLRLKEP